MRLPWVGVLLGYLLVGCATTRVVHLDTGDGAPIVYTPPKGIQPITIEADEFQKMMARLVLDMRFSLQAPEEKHLRLRLASWNTEGPGPHALDGDYRQWCSRQENPEECLTLLNGRLSLLDASARRDLALSFAWDGVWEGVRGAVKEVINPLSLKLMITSAMAGYMILLVAPEPITKLVALALTTYLVAYLGLDVFFDIVNGWRRLTMDSEKAVSIQELEDTGRRFGKVMGKDGARVLIMALTAALGGEAANMSSKGPLLPSFARAALAAETNAGFQMSAALAGGVRSISVVEGVMTVGLAPTAVAASAWDEDGAPSKSDHARQRQAEGRPVGTAFNDAANARPADVFIQSEDGRFVVRAPRGREHIFERDGTLVTTVDGRSAATHLRRVQNGDRRPVSEDEFNAFLSIFKR